MRIVALETFPGGKSKDIKDLTWVETERENEVLTE